MRPPPDFESWKWENATAGATAGFATVAVLHPLDVVRTRFQVSDGRISNLPAYKNTAHAVYAIARTEGTGGLYAGFNTAVLGSTISWGLYFYFYNKAKDRYSKSNQGQLKAVHHLLSATEAGALVCLFTNPIWLVKTRLELQTPHHHHRPYSGFSDAFKTIFKEEGWHALFKGIGPGLLLVSHGAIQFTIYEELRNAAVNIRRKDMKSESSDGVNLKSFDYAAIGASSKIAAMMLTYPFQVIRARLQQRPNLHRLPKYWDSWHVIRETVRLELMGCLEEDGQAIIFE